MLLLDHAELLTQSHFRQIMGSTLLRASCAMSATVIKAAGVNGLAD